MFYEKILRPLFFLITPERVHHLSLKVLGLRSVQKLLTRCIRSQVAQRPVSLWGLTFPNPIGLAAGFDKNGEALLGWEALGFGFIEVGTITHLKQEGNPSPRIFRLPAHRGLINRMGFPNEGAQKLALHFRALKEKGLWPSVPVGINLGKSKLTPIEEAEEDYLASWRILKEFGDYFVINVSSPNTPSLRTLQSKSALGKILGLLQKENRATPEKPSKPLLVKIAPDLSWQEIEDVLDCVAEYKLQGIVATNTTLARPKISEPYEGGLSGEPLREKSLAVVRFISKKTEGKLPIIGVGGISTPQHAQQMLDAGASLIQIYTGFIYKGPYLNRDICASLASRK